MSSLASVGAGAGAARPAQRVEVYVLTDAAGGGPLVLTGPGGAARVPGAVLSHGEGPRQAALRALADRIADDRPAGTELHLHAVLSDVRTEAGRPGLHVLRLVFGTAGAVPVAVDQPLELPFDPALLRDPVPAWVNRRPPGSPPQVQRPAAYAVVVRDGEALLSRVTGHGVWTLPGGGIDHGEHPDEAVRRETFEETGLRLASARLVDVDSRHFTGRSPAQVTEDFHGVRILYRGTVTERRPPAVQEIGGSTDAAAWVPLERLAQLRLTDIARTILRQQR